MTTKYFLGAVAAICLSATFAVAQDTPLATNLDELNDTLEGLTGNFDDLQTLQFSPFEGGSYLGVSTEDINRSNMATYNMSQPRGVGVTQVLKDSPAEKAGLRKGDVILRFDSENVTSVRKLNRLISEVAPDQTVRLSISRAGAEQELSATVARRQNTFAALTPGGDAKVWKWEGPTLNGENFSFAFANSRRLGISTTELTKQLADFFGVPGGKGVLVTSVNEEDPAAKAGLKAGDVITSIDGEAVDSTGDISRIINAKKEGEVTVTFIRNKTQQSVRVTPREGGPFHRTVVSPQMGRQIVIPRVTFPPFPEVSISIPGVQIQPVPAINISMPAIQIPMPAINVQMPAIKVVPKNKVKTVVAQPL